MNEVLLYNHGGCENRGCEAIVRSTSELFAREAGVRATLASKQPAFDRGVGLSCVRRVFDCTIAPYSARRFINSVGFRLGMPREHEVARRYAPVIAQGRRSDVCLSVGGDTYCYGPQEHLSVINARLKRAGKPLVLWGCSVEPDVVRGEALADLRRYDLIVARESISAQMLADAGLPVKRWCDPAFTLAREDVLLPQGFVEGKTIGLNVSPLILSRAQDGEAALDAFVQLIGHILSTGDDAVALLPHVTWAHDDDRQALAALKARFADEPRVLLLPGDLRATQYKGIIARMRALVTARTHASIAAYSTAVPTLVIGYSVKARGIARDLFGAEEGHLIPVQELRSAQQLIAAFDAMLAREDEERAFLKDRLPAYTAGAGEIVREVMALSKGGCA